MGGSVDELSGDQARKIQFSLDSWLDAAHITPPAVTSWMGRKSSKLVRIRSKLL